MEEPKGRFSKWRFSRQWKLVRAEEAHKFNPSLHPELLSDANCYRLLHTSLFISSIVKIFTYSPLRLSRGFRPHFPYKITQTLIYIQNFINFCIAYWRLAEHHKVNVFLFFDDASLCLHILNDENIFTIQQIISNLYQVQRRQIFILLERNTTV